MKLSISACILKSLALQALSHGISAMRMTNMLMSQDLNSFLSELVSFGDLSIKQKQNILNMADAKDEYRTDVFNTPESKEALKSYLLEEISSGSMDKEAAEAIGSTLSLGELYPMSASAASTIAAMTTNGPVQAVYDLATQGNMVRLGSSNIFSSTSNSGYNGIWGYATGDREYALQCHGQGFAILDVTDPASIFRVQFVAMSGGGYWRDVATHTDTVTGKTYAYVGSQGTQGGGNSPNLFVFDLSYLSGDIANPNGVDEDPIPNGNPGWLNLGYTDLTHTINVARGLLFLNTGRSTTGCQVFDLTTDPMDPLYLFTTGGRSAHQCHDSFVRENIDGKDILFVSDGNGQRERIYDITNVDASWPTDQLPDELGFTAPDSSIYAHESWLSEDNRYLFEFDENNNKDILVHDVSDLTAPVQIAIMQYSEQGSTNALPHNGEIRGNYLYAAYYEAGLRVFDISNPYLPVEVGKVETHRDPDGDGSYTNPIVGTYEGAWNTYPYLPSGNILVSDIYGGLFIVKANAAYSQPAAPSATCERDGSDDVVVAWNAVANARGYSIERSLDGGANFEVIAEHMIDLTFTDTPDVRGVNAWYRVNAVNGEGTGTSAIEAAIVGTGSPSTSPTRKPTASPVTPSPTNSPVTPSPTNNPTNAPTTSPVLPGTCSDDMVTPCSTTLQCGCGSGGGAQEPQSAKLFDRQLRGLRKLQDPCVGKKNKDCIDTCTWQGGVCVSNTPPGPSPTNSPTSKPTSNPTKSPTTKPTRSPTQCTCMLTAFPTAAPVADPTNPPTEAPTPGPGPSCDPAGASCSNNCCNGCSGGKPADRVCL